jgi:hypothetical protein
MARVKLPSSAKTDESVVYTVSKEVGPGCPNHRDDVLLVQYFLREVPKHIYCPADLKGAKVDVTGITSKTFFEQIMIFQKAALTSSGWLLATDGKVSPIPRASKLKYHTIQLLAGIYKANRPTDFTNISVASDCPVDLAKALQC